MRKSINHIRKALHQLTLQFIASFCAIIFSTNTLVASGNADVSISYSSATANGSWSALSGGVYTFTPSANSAVIIYTDIQNRLIGSGFTAGSVTIRTACSGAGSQNGNVTHSAVTMTAATTSTTQLTFTITAAGYITIGQLISFTPGSNAGTGYPATNIVLTGTTGVNISQPIASVGGATTGVATTGGVGGALTCTSSGGTVTIGNSVTVTGGTGGSGGGAGPGGTGGAITLSGAIVAINQPMYAQGGAGSATGAGGKGGAVNITSTSSTVSIGNLISTVGGAGATSGIGGNGGAMTITAATTVSFTQPITSAGGNSGSGNGGNGGAISITSSSGALSIGNSITATGGNPGGGSNKNGGTGGAVTVSASTNLNISQPIYANAGTPTGAGTATGGDITIVGPGGITLSNLIQTTGTTTGGTITINDGNSSITAYGGVNDGQGGASYFQAGAINKIGTGNFNLAHAGNSWTGATKITAGKLTLGASNTIPDASQLYFNGGRLVMGAYSETVGTIMVNAYSVLDLPSGNYTLTASASNGVTWTTGKKLGIIDWGVVGNNFSGTLAGGSDPKFFIGGSAGLDATHKAAIYFTRVSNGSNYTSTQLASGEIVPTAALPVKLIAFDAVKNNQSVDISWSTASEINSDYFDIMRCGIDTKWELIGTIRAAGNSNKILHYAITDTSPRPGINYYKMVEYDFDGTSQESKVLSVSNPVVVLTHLTAFPNPTNNSTTFIFYTENAGSYYLKVFSTLGEQVYKALLFGNEGENRFSINMQDYAEGTYSFQLYSEAQMLSEIKVVKAN
jgi:hypothetical protein